MSKEGVNESREEFERVPGFLDARAMGMDLSSPKMYEKASLSVPQPGEYNVSDGVIAAVNSRNQIMVWLPKSGKEAEEPKGYSYEQSIKDLEEEGYTRADFQVPKLNEGSGTSEIAA